MTAMTKEEFKKLWESGEWGGGITYDDIAKCAVAWGVFAQPKTCRIDVVRYQVLKAAGTVDAEEFTPDEEQA